jgi:PIN domain nuclease of toxin-antitoxin system
MKRYLLDTHILLWWLADDKKLVKKTKDLIASPANHVLVSTVSIWEIIIKKSLNKLKVPDNLKEILYENDFEILPITVDHVLYVEHLPALHNDPFDRLLIAQNIVEDLTFITVDEIIPKYDVTCLKH